MTTRVDSYCRLSLMSDFLLFLTILHSSSMADELIMRHCDDTNILSQHSVQIEHLLPNELNESAREMEE